MAKIPFSIEHREKIESGEYKVFAHEHVEQEARIVCWDNKGKYPIVALVDNEPEKFDKHGRVPGGNRGGEFSLFIVTPEPRLTEFEKAFDNLAESYHSDNNPDDVACCKEYAAKLLPIARKQLQPEIDAEIEKAYKNADEVQYEKGRADALKDLPRWEKCPLYFEHGEIGKTNKDEDILSYQGYSILLSDLAKLPKEE